MIWFELNFSLVWFIFFKISVTPFGCFSEAKPNQTTIFYLLDYESLNLYGLTRAQIHKRPVVSVIQIRSPCFEEPMSNWSSWRAMLQKSIDPDEDKSELSPCRSWIFPTRSCHINVSLSREYRKKSSKCRCKPKYTARIESVSESENKLVSPHVQPIIPSASLKLHAVV